MYILCVCVPNIGLLIIFSLSFSGVYVISVGKFLICICVCVMT